MMVYGRVAKIVDQMMGGLISSCGACGCSGCAGGRLGEGPEGSGLCNKVLVYRYAY